VEKGSVLLELGLLAVLVSNRSKYYSKAENILLKKEELKAQTHLTRICTACM
jgi:hypothetical protein